MAKRDRLRPHAKLSPSSAARWLNCTAAPTLEAMYPNESSSYAEEGTLAHKFAEAYAAYELNPRVRLNARCAKMRQEAIYDPEMEDHARSYAEYVGARFEDAKQNCPDPQCMLEVRLDLREWVPEAFGTADCVIIADERMYVIDYKYGKGVKVEAENNPQMMLYALGALSKYGLFYDVKEIVMTIFQPRLGSVEEHIISAAALLGWANHVVAPAAKTAFEGPGEFKPSEDACRFCKAKGECRARVDLVVQAFDETPPELLPRLTLDEIGALLEKSKDMSAWLKDLEAAAFTHMMNGDHIPGYKLVEGRSNRRYTDEESAVDHLVSNGYELADIANFKIKTITQLEKEIGKKEFTELMSGYIEKPKGALKIAPESDKRPAVSPEGEVLKAFDE